MPKFIIDTDKFLIPQKVDDGGYGCGDINEKIVGEKTVNVRRLKRLLSARDCNDGSYLHRFTIVRLPN